MIMMMMVMMVVAMMVVIIKFLVPSVDRYNHATWL